MQEFKTFQKLPVLFQNVQVQPFIPSYIASMKSKRPLAISFCDFSDP